MSREQDRIKKLGREHRGITNRLKLKLSKKDIDTVVYIFISKMSSLHSLQEIIESRKTKLADILTEEMIDNCLHSQDSSDQNESTEFDTEEKLDTAKSNEIMESIQNTQEFIGDLVRRKDTTFNQYSDKLKALGRLMNREVEETVLADVPFIESNHPDYGNLIEYHHVIRFGPMLETVTKKLLPVHCQC